MPIVPDLRAEAEAEAARIDAIKARPPADAAPLAAGAVVFTCLRHCRTKGLIQPAAIFLTRTRVVDGRGRLVEDFLIPVEVRTAPTASLRKRRDIVTHALHVFKTCQQAVRSAVLTEVARRISALATAHGRGLERARARESRLAELAARRLHERVQPGLFDRRALQDRDRALHLRSTMTSQHLERRQTLDTSASLLVARQSEIVLFMIVSAEGKPRCCPA